MRANSAGFGEISRRALFGVAAGAALTRPSAAQATRPNVVVILADDQGWGDLSVHGNSNLSTPKIDSLARDGALFERFYVCAVCAPTRAEFLTGRYHPRSGVRGVTTGAERLSVDEKTIADTFKAAGYATAAFGKWHNGSQHPYHPNARGFDEYYGFTSGHWGDYFDAEMEHNGKLVRGKGYITDDLADHALRFIETNRSRPFFCYLPLNTPHSPMQVPDRFFEKFQHLDPKLRATRPDAEEPAMTRAALAMCESIDFNVGRVLSKLDQLQLAGNTIVVYFSDNGPNSWRWNGGMKGRKGSLDEGGLRVPCLMRWTGKIPAGTRIDRIAGAIDLLPTLTDLAGVSPAPKKPLDGRSLKPLLLGKTSDWTDRMIFTMQSRKVSVRTQQFRLDSDHRLFDINADPGQQRDISAERSDVTAKLRKASEDWGREMLPLVGPDDRPFPVGYSEITLLPARDGVPHGSIKRSASAPNCSYFTNWTTKQDEMSWDIEVGKSGDYEAAVYYTCRAADVGSTVELSFGASRVTCAIRPAHDPPLEGKAEDRVNRGPESYVKDFRPLRLGTLKLNAGRGKLILRATEIPGQQVADVRRIQLTRGRG